ncbi:MAG: flagellar motor protein MotB [Gammaproteobacteria bacterium]
MDDEAPADPGVPAWVMTFADLMSLLMCFFVLLLAFSEMDAQKFKQLSGSMKEAFGVQADIKADFIPKGTSVVTREFSPGKPVPTNIDAIRQFTIDSTKSTLDHLEKNKDDEEQLERDLQKLREALRDEIKNGLATVERDGSRIIVQIHEHGSFPSGTADLRASILPTIDKLAYQVVRMDGVVQVTGHTDNLPIKTTRFRSNWDLSSARAVSVAHRLMSGNGVKPDRMVVTGLADTLPLAANDTAQNRALNRRVQVSVIRTAAAAPLELPQEAMPDSDDVAQQPTDMAEGEPAAEPTRTSS